MKRDIKLIPYGKISSRLTGNRWLGLVSRHAHPSKRISKADPKLRNVFISFSSDLDDSFIEMFRGHATEDTRLLVLHWGTSTDWLVSQLVNLQIRTPERFYVMETNAGSEKALWSAFIPSLLKRIQSGFEAADERLLHARIEDGTLRAVSANFNRLDVPVSRIPALKDITGPRLQEFEIDDDGSFIYWPKVDVHLGWRQLEQLVNPEAALRASQKNEHFNQRYGMAVQRLREELGLKRSAIPGISEKQLNRIERGQCRLTSNAIQALSKAHSLKPNDYMRRLAESLESPRHGRDSRGAN
jgi:hypothetical protein